MNNYSHLSLEERTQIYQFSKENCSNNEIARRLKRDKGTISRELSRNEYNELVGYLPDSAHQKMQDRKYVLKFKIDQNEILKNYIFDKLKEKWSPDIIAHKAKIDINMNISSETIYQYIYHPDNQHLGWHQFLMSGRKKRNPFKGRKARQKVIPNQVSIHERPEVINNRLEPGHFEGDLTFFTGDQSRNVGVLIDRATRFLIFIKNESKRSTEVIKNMFNALAQLPEHMRKSVTFDNGLEFTYHELLQQFLSMKTYFCDKHSPWQKGSIERHNAMLHWWLPKNIVISQLSEQELFEVQNKMNNRPRKMFGYQSAAELFYRNMQPQQNLIGE